MKRTSDRLWLGGLAAAGVVLAHSLAYLLMSPDPHARERLLSATGHRFFTWLCALALGGLVACVTGGSLQRIRDRSSGGPKLRFATAAALLSLLQGGGFVVLEAAERMLAGGSPADLLGEPVILIGIAMQFVVALIAALLFIGLVVTVDRIAARLTRPVNTSTSTIHWWATSVHAPRLALGASGRTLRGPPASFG